MGDGVGERWGDPEEGRERKLGMVYKIIKYCFNKQKRQKN